MVTKEKEKKRNGKKEEKRPGRSRARWHKSQRYNDWGVWVPDWQLGRVFGQVRMKNEERNAGTKTARCVAGGV
jgi:hypothetical protein